MRPTHPQVCFFISSGSRDSMGALCVILRPFPVRVLNKGSSCFINTIYGIELKKEKKMDINKYIGDAILCQRTCYVKTLRGEIYCVYEHSFLISS